MGNCAEGVRHKALHYWEDVAHEAHRLGCVVLVQVPLEVVDRKFVRIFEFAVVLAANLNCVVGQVDVPTVQVSQIKGLRGGSEVAVTIHIALQTSVD